MSFILDALRKSENERRELSSPALAATPQTTATKKSSVWLPILAVVLAINAIVIVTFLLNRDEPAAVAERAAQPDDAAVRSLRKESIAETKPVTPAPVIAVDSTPAPTPVEPPATTVASTEASPATPETIRDGLPTLDQLRTAGLVSVGNMRVDMHVYAGDPKKRFVFVNMTKYREGDRLSEGPTLEEITPDGVIMAQQGHRFRLDRD